MKVILEAGWGTGAMHRFPKDQFLVINGMLTSAWLPSLLIGSKCGSNYALERECRIVSTIISSQQGQNQLKQTKPSFGSKKCEFSGFFCKKNATTQFQIQLQLKEEIRPDHLWTHFWWSFLVKTPFLNLAGAQDLQVLEVLGEIHGGGQVEDNMLVAWGKSQGGFFWGWFFGIRWAPYKLWYMELWASTSTWWWDPVCRARTEIPCIFWYRTYFSW